MENKFYTGCCVAAERYETMLMLFEKENIKPIIKQSVNGIIVMGGYMTAEQVKRINSYIMRGE